PRAGSRLRRQGGAAADQGGGDQAEARRCRDRREEARLLRRWDDDRLLPIYANDDRIGKVTSACYSPRLEKNIGYAMVPIEFAELGTEFTVETPDEGTSAVVVRKPFIDPKKEIPK